MLVLSESGRKIAESLVEQKPIEKTVQFFIDGLSGEPIAVNRASLLTAAQLDEAPHLILEEPELDFGPQDTDRFLAATARSQGRDQDVLLSVIRT